MNTLRLSRPAAAAAGRSTLVRPPASQCHAAQRCRRRPAAAAGGSGGGGAGSGSGEHPAPPQQQQQHQHQQQQQHQQRPRSQPRREVLLRSINWLVLAEMAGGSDDGRTLINSVLGAYGLPQLKPTKGFRVYDDPEEPFTFLYPASWVRRKNNRRQGLAISDYGTADKLSLEIFPEPPGSSSASELAAAAVQQLMFPASEIGGDARLELPPASRIKSEQQEIDGKVYTYIAFPSETTTRSGYQVKRKNLAVAAARRGSVYVLGCSARSDQFDKEKEAAFETVVQSFRLL